MFEVEGTKSLDSNAITFVKKGINFVGRTFEDNGIQGKIDKRDFEPNNPYTITATVIGNYKYVKYQKEPYYCSQNINKLTPKTIFERWNEKIAYFIIASIQRFVSQYDGQQGGYKLEDIKNHIIELPLKNNKIDFDFMETFVAELEAQRVAELKNYLEVSGLDDYELSNRELEVLKSYDSVEWGEYRIGDLFDSYNGNFDIQKKHINDIGEYVITAGVSNNGILGKSDIEAKIFNPKTITVDMFGYAFYRSFKYKMVTHARVFSLVPKFKITENQGMFLESSLSYLKKLFGYENMCSFAKIKNLTTTLPLKNGKIDFDFMETYISAITKLAIKDVVKYADKRIAATKKIVNKQ